MRKLLLLPFALLPLLIGCDANVIENDTYNWTKYDLIAHAGGGIDGKTYTNSVEAFKLNYENGFRLFEFDIAITSDNILVARHGWDDDIGQELIDGNPLKHQEFMDTFYYGQYQPMDFKMILELLEEYPDIYIILDGKVESPEDVEVLYKLVGEAVKDLDERVLARLIPQMFYENDVEVIRNYGFRDLLYVVGREEYTPESLVEFCLENDVRAVSLSVKRTNKEIVEALKEKDIKVYTYTLNDLDLMQKLLDIGVNGFFTDFINNLEQTVN